jgi:hypothetical protein
VFVNEKGFIRMTNAGEIVFVQMFVNLSKGEKMDLKYKGRQRGNRKRDR